MLQYLEENPGKYVSGSEMAEALGMSRNSIWKAVQNLKNKGYEINAVTNKGYMLSVKNKFISKEKIEQYIDSDKIRTEYRARVTSTNTLLKQRGSEGEEEGLLLVSSEQTEGKGRKGREFISNRNCGIYFSLLLRPDFTPEQSLYITTCAAVAVAKAIEKNTGIDTQIKWVNDIYKNNKKICGILTEATFDMEGGRLDYAVLGIGINMFYPEYLMPASLKPIAGSIYDDDNYNGDDVCRIVADTVNIFMKEYECLTDKNYLDDYRARDCLKGKQISVIKNDTERKATALGIDDNFRLHVQYVDGKEEYLSSGEVSTKMAVTHES